MSCLPLLWWCQRNPNVLFTSAVVVSVWLSLLASLLMVVVRYCGKHLSLEIVLQVQFFLVSCEGQPDTLSVYYWAGLT